MLLAENAIGFFHLENILKQEGNQSQGIHAGRQGGNLHFRQIRGGQIPLGKTGFPVRTRGIRSGGIMIAGRDFPGQELFGFHRMQSHVPLLTQQHQVIAVHQFVAGAHHLAEHHLRSLIHAHVIPVGLGHLPHAVQTFQKRHRHGDLRQHAFLLLKVAAHQDVEKLVRPAQLHVRTDFHGIPALHNRILHLM